MDDVFRVPADDTAGALGQELLQRGKSLFRRERTGWPHLEFLLPCNEQQGFAGLLDLGEPRSGVFLELFQRERHLW